MNTKNKCIEWYNMIAKRNGGYRSDAVFTREGKSGEEEFEKRLIALLPKFSCVLDIGCGHGEFAVKMAQYTKKIIGVDYSVELIKIAEKLKQEKVVNNLEFIYATTKMDLPFENEQFDFIYDRRGPTSILDHKRILKKSGTILGIHTWDLELEQFKKRIHKNGFSKYKIEVFDNAVMYFQDKKEFGKYLAACHLNPDYTSPEYSKELDRIINENMINGKIAWPEKRYIWQVFND